MSSSNGSSFASADSGPKCSSFTEGVEQARAALRQIVHFLAELPFDADDLAEIDTAIRPQGAHPPNKTAALAVRPPSTPARAAAFEHTSNQNARHSSSPV